MVRILVAIALVLLLASCGSSNLNSSLDGNVSLFGLAWNSNCAACNFDTNANVAITTTLGDMYHGSNFKSDIAVMDTLISMSLGQPSGLADAGFEALYIYYDDLGDDID